jgi:hypothetical protein
MIFAQISTNPWDAPVTLGAWLGCLLFVLMLINAAGKVWDRFTGKSKVPQPMNVEIVKALHEQFADKQTFEKHVAHTTQRHSQIFASIDRVEREGRKNTDERFKELNEERRQTLDKLTTEFTFIRENIAAINRELQIRHEQN